MSSASPATAASLRAGDPLPRRHVVLAVVAIALLMASVDQTIVSTALASVQGDLDAPINWSTWTITVYALGQILAMPLAGRLSDQYGRARVFLAAVVVFTISSLLCGLAANIYELVALRALQSLGGGAFLPSAVGIISDCYGRDRDRAIGLFTSVFTAGALVGPVMGGLFVTYWSWRGIFFINVPLGLLLLCLGSLLIPKGTRGAHERIDLAGIVLFIVGLLGFMFAISSLGADGADVPEVLGALVIGLLALAAFARHSALTAHPFIPLALLLGRRFVVVNGINLLSGATVLAFGALLPIYAMNRYGLSVLASGLLLSARAVGTMAIASASAFALRRTGYRWPMRIGFGVIATGMVLLSLPARGLGPQAWLAATAAITGVGMGIMIPASNNAGIELAPANAAAISGIQSMSRQIGGITGVSVVAAVSAASADAATAQAYAFLVFGVVLVLIIPFVSLVPERRGGW